MSRMRDHKVLDSIFVLFQKERQFVETGPRLGVYESWNVWMPLRRRQDLGTLLLEYILCHCDVIHGYVPHSSHSC